MYGVFDEIMAMFNCEAIYGAKAKEALIKVSWHQDDGSIMTGCLRPAECRDLAQNLLQAAEASEQDAFFLEFIQQQCGQPLQSAVLVLRDFREWRKKKGSSE